MQHGRITEKTKREIVDLYTGKRLGIKAISKWFNGSPSKTTVERILREAGVYQGPERVNEQHAKTVRRRERVLAEARTWRHRMAVCLWNLRRGIGVETTCRWEGWPTKTIWNYLKDRPAYRKLRQTINATVDSERVNHARLFKVSRAYPQESQFAERVAHQFRKHGVEYVREPAMANTRYRADFEALGHIIECKVDLTHMQVKTCLGQCWLYRCMQTKPVVVVVPYDILVPSLFEQALSRMEVDMITEVDLPDWIGKHGGVQESSYPLTTGRVLVKTGLFERHHDFSISHINQPFNPTETA